MTTLHEERVRPQAGDLRARESTTATGSETTVPHRIDRFLHDVLLDVLLSGERRYWLKRAEDFAKVGTPACDEIARACRARAEVSPVDHIREDIAAVLREVGA